MNTPPWHPQTDEDVTAFKEFVLDQLNRLNTAYLFGAEGARSVMLLTQVRRATELKRELSEIGVHIPPPRKKRGGQPKRKENCDNQPKSQQESDERVALAIRDVERMRVIFRQHWGKVNRHHRPTREDIAAEFHQLSSEEKRALEAHFKKAAKPADPQKS